ncbi:MAG TPA: hypothetical protein VKX17_03065 [Planctomycetota bacterium]|nr:hypothetical protein [Planctomycetota bacterium]
MKDLILLLADKNAQFALKGALERPKAIGIRKIEFDFRVHAGRDGGVRKSGPETLALLRRQFNHALLVLDYEGSGAGAQSALELEAELDERLKTVWQDAAKAIVIEPELDIWIWGSDNAIKQVIKWPIGGTIRNWIKGKGFNVSENSKPDRPKEALEAVLRELDIPRSSSLYHEITSRISLARCKDMAFQRMRQKLASWFPPPVV